MLIQFEVENFLSIKEKQNIYFIANKNARIKNTRYEDNFNCDFAGYKIMKSAVIFGGNATGKTNLILGIEKMKNIILNGLDFKTVEYFHYGTDYVSFGIVLLDRNVKEYEYKITYNRSSVLYEELSVNEELLYKFQDKKLAFGETIILEDKKEIEKIFSVESTDTILKKLSDHIKPYIVDFKNAIEDIIVIFDDRSEKITNGIKIESTIVTSEEKNRLYKNRAIILAILKILDSKIDAIDFEKFSVKDNHSTYKIYFKRKGSTERYFLDNESKGIMKIMAIIGNLTYLFAEHKVLLIDELDSSISTKTLIELFNQFINSKANQGQMIVSSHNAFLMDNRMFHPQQLYLVDKNEDLGTEIYSVDDFHLRSEKRRLYDDYLKGRFGGING